MLNGEGLKLAQRYFKPAWIGHLSQRGSRSAHLGLLEQNVIDRVGSAAWCGEVQGIGEGDAETTDPGSGGVGQEEQSGWTESSKAPSRKAEEAGGLFLSSECLLSCFGHSLQAQCQPLLRTQGPRPPGFLHRGFLPERHLTLTLWIKC